MEDYNITDGYSELADGLCGESATALVNYYLESDSEGQYRQLKVAEFLVIISYFLLMGKDREGLEANRRAIAVHPDSAALRLVKVKNLISMGEVEAAEEEMDYIKRNFPPSADIYNTRASLLLMRGKPEAALRLLRKSLETGGAGSVERALADEVGKLLQISMEIEDGGSKAYLLTAAANLQTGDTSRAVTHAAKAIRLNPDTAKTMPGIMQKNARNAEPEQMRRFYWRLTEEFPLEADLWNELGFACTQCGDYHAAIDAYKYQKTLEPDNPDILYAIGQCHVCLEDFENALACFNEANGKSDGRRFLVPAGICLYNLGREKDAETCLLKATPDCLNYDDGADLLLAIYVGRGDFAPALKILTEHYKVTPDAVEQLTGLLLIALPLSKQTGDYTIPLKQCALFFDKHNDKLPQVFWRIICFCYDYRLTDFGILLCTTYSEEPRLCDILGYYMAALHILDGNIEEGCRHLENALLINPQNCAEHFIGMDSDMGSHPKVLEILEMHKEEIGCDDFDMLFE